MWIFRWTYQSPNETGMASHWGKVATYSGGGFVVDLPKPATASKDKLESLKKNLWLDQGTRAVIVDLTIYNANLNLFATVR